MATQIPQKIIVNSLKLLFISTSFASCFELLYNGNFLNYFLQVKKVYRRFHLDRRITAPIDIYCLIFTSLRWTLGPFLMGWQNLAKLSLCLADQYSSTSISIYDNDQYSCLLLLHLDINFDNIQMNIVTMMISLPLIMMMTMMMASELKCPHPTLPPTSWHSSPSSKSIFSSLLMAALAAGFPSTSSSKSGLETLVFTRTYRLTNFQPKPEYKRSHYFAMLPRIPPPFNRQSMTMFFSFAL